MRWWVVLHVVIAFGFVAGLIGRNITLAKARATDDLGQVRALVGLATRFERLLVIPGSFAVLVAGLIAMVAQGRSLTGPRNGWLLVSLVLFVALFAFVPTVFLPRGKVFDAALEDATVKGTMTPELQRAFADPVVAFARNAELVVVVVIIALMVAKPF